MGAVVRLLERRSSLENPSTPLSDPDAWLYEAFGARKSRAGTQISQQTALNLSAVWAAVRVLTDTVASIPLPVYERLQPRGKRRATSHPMYRILHDRPNPEMTSFVFREVLQGHLATWGNGYAEIERSNGGRPLALWPITPDRVTPFRRGGRRWYRVRVGEGRDAVIGADDMLHIPGFGFDGLQGYSPITLARESLGLAKATEEFGASWFGNGSRVGGVLQHPGKLGDQAQRHVRESWADTHQGLDNAHRVAILEEGMTWQQIGIPPDDAQFLETRKFQTEEIARWFKVPPHMIQHLDRSTFNNIEHQGIEFVVHTARPWFVRWEQVLNNDLFGARSNFFTEFLLSGLLRGDSQARSNFYQTGIRSGWLSIDDIREMENLNPVEGGERYFIQRDMIPLDAVDELVASLNPTPSEPKPPVADDGRAEWATGVRESHEQLFREAAESAVKKEVVALRAALGKAHGGRDAAKLRTLIDEFYDDFPAWLTDRLRAPVGAYAATIGAVTGIESGLGKKWSEASAERVRAVVAETEPDEVETVLEAVLTEWGETRAAAEAKAVAYAVEANIRNG